MIGIYRIKNTVNGKCYYGSSKDIDNRFIQHKAKLNNKTHDNIILQRSWNKHGGNNFVFEYVEECEKDKLFEVEQKYLDLNPFYNIGKNASGGDNLTNNPNREKIIENIKKGGILRFAKMSDDERKLKLSKPGNTNPNWKGGTCSKKCECGNSKSYYSLKCNNCVDKSGVNNAFYGKNHTKETKDKLSLLQKGSIKNGCNKIFLIDDIEYRTLKDASDKLNILEATIQHRLNSKNPLYKNYNYKGETKIFYSDEELKEKKNNKINKQFMIDNIIYNNVNDASNKTCIKICTIYSRLRNVNYPNYKFIDIEK